MAEHIKQKIQGGKKSICDSCAHRNVCKAIDNQPCTECNHYQCTADVEPVQEWINSEEMLPEFPCLIVRPDGKAVTIPEGILTIKDEHGEWCINASLDYAAKLMDGSEITTLAWENRITYWMPLPQLPKGE